MAKIPYTGTIFLIVLLSILTFLCHAAQASAPDLLETEIHWYKCNLFTNERRNTTRPTPSVLQQYSHPSNTNDPSLTKEDVDKLISTVSRWMQRGGMDPSEFESPLNVVTRKEREILPMLARRNALARNSAAVPHTEESLPYAPVAECAQVYVPLNYSKPNGRKIELFVKRIRPEIQQQGSTHAKASKQLWLLQGGPGGSSDGWIERMMSVLYLHYDGEYELYTMDHRGVGRSTRLACDGSQAETIGSEDGTAISVNEMYDCAKEIVDKYAKDNDKAGFSTTGAAEDLKHIIELTKTSEHTTFVYGVSYGTLWASRMMQLPGIEDLVRGVILDGLCPQTTDIMVRTFFRFFLFSSFLNISTHPPHESIMIMLEHIISTNGQQEILAPMTPECCS